MPVAPPGSGELHTFDAPSLETLISILRGRGFTVVGPVLRDGAVVLDEIEGAADLPAGVTDEQDAGRYRVTKGAAGRLFDFVNGPDSWKRRLHPPALRLLKAARHGKDFATEPPDEPPPKLALFGVRACDLAAIAVQDRVFLGGTYTDPAYRARREGAFVVAVACTRAGGTCFCTSTGTGPAPSRGFDLSLTPIGENGTRAFVVSCGSSGGAEILAGVPHRPATDAERGEALHAVAQAEAHMGRTLRTEGLKDWLLSDYEHPQWDDVAKRCLACGNCTLACPTCFCTTLEDQSDLAGTTAERVRRWDSCFTPDFSYIHGGSVRPSIRARYRQWLTHKLATWHEQFGMSGCVGCGRCITWCPAGIDLTEEVRALARSTHAEEERRAHA